MTTGVQWLRRAVQSWVLVVLIVVAVVAGQRAVAPDHGIAATETGWLDAVRGNSWSFEIGMLSLTDPVAGAEALAAGKAITSALLVGLALPVLATVLLGRVFCSWVCPVGFLLEGTDRLRNLARWSPRRNLGFWRGNKYALLGVGLALSAALSVPLLGLIYPPAVLARELHQWAYAAAVGDGGPWRTGVTWGFGILLGVVVVEVFVSRRAWCRSFCPGGALYSLLGAWRLVKVTPPDDHCDRCGLCVTACDMGLNPMTGTTGIECDNCLACLSHCAPDALHLTASGQPPQSAANR